MRFRMEHGVLRLTYHILWNPGVYESRVARIQEARLQGWYLATRDFFIWIIAWVRTFQGEIKSKQSRSFTGDSEGNCLWWGFLGCQCFDKQDPSLRPIWKTWYNWYYKSPMDEKTWKGILNEYGGIYAQT